MKPDIQGRSLQKYGDYLSRNGLKSTMQRDIIINEFFGTSGHVSVDELHSTVRKAHPSVGIATVYRTLKILLNAGLARERKFNDGLTRYEYVAPDDKHHDHMVCVSCGLVEEFKNDEIEKLQRKVAARRKFTMLDHNLEIYGLCKKCSADEKKRGKADGRSSVGLPNR